MRFGRPDSRTLKPHVAGATLGFGDFKFEYDAAGFRRRVHRFAQTHQRLVGCADVVQRKQCGMHRRYRCPTIRLQQRQEFLQRFARCGTEVAQAFHGTLHEVWC